MDPSLLVLMFSDKGGNVVTETTYTGICHVKTGMILLQPSSYQKLGERLGIDPSLAPERTLALPTP